MMEKYSVLMSVYAKENPTCFREAVLSMLDQTCKPSDFVIVCDGPLTRDLDSVIREFAAEHADLFQIIRLPQNKGLGSALCAGLAECKCDLVARMDTDDIACKDRMEKQLQLFEEKPALTVVGGQIQEFITEPDNRTGYRIVPALDSEIKKRLNHRNPMNHVTVTFRKDAVMAVGSYEAYEGFEDYQLWAKMMKHGYCFENLSDVLVYVRVGNSMLERRGGMRYFAKALKFERYLKSNQMINTFEYSRNVTERFLACIAPKWLRGVTYHKVMRKGRHQS